MDLARSRRRAHGAAHVLDLAGEDLDHASVVGDSFFRHVDRGDTADVGLDLVRGRLLEPAKTGQTIRRAALHQRAQTR